MKEQRMLYRAYKADYADCKTVPGSWDPITKTIVVQIPEGREKASGVRGQRFHSYYFRGIDHATGKERRICIKAVCIGNAEKRLPSGADWSLA